MKMQAREQVERLVSAGGVVLRVVDGEAEVVLCGLEAPEQWRLPKGTPDSGETLEETAVREVREETGLEVELRKPLYSINYSFVRPPDGVRCHKTVHFYLMESTGGSTDLHDLEFDVVRWFPLEEAVKKLAYPNEAHVVEEAARLLAEGNGGWG